MNFTNRLPIRVVCAWCHIKEKLANGTWVPVVSPVNALQQGMCTDCESQWRAEETRVNQAIKATLPRLTKHKKKKKPASA